MNKDVVTFQEVQRKPIVNEIVEQLQKKISLGELPIGAQIPTEPELMKMFGVGRSTIREAVRVLVHAGLLSKRQGQGTFVTGASGAGEPLDLRLRRAEVLDVYEVRFMLEVEIARLAALRRDERDLARMRECLELRNRSLAAGDRKAYLDADVAFHLAVAQASKNAVAADVYGAFAEVLRQALEKHVADPEIHNHYTEQHVSLYEAICRRDAEAAAASTLLHLQGVKQELESLLG